MKSLINLKNIVLLIREKIYFKNINDIKMKNTIIISSNDIITKKDMANYHEYYLKYKKSA